MLYYPPHSCWTNYCCCPHLLQQQRAGKRARERSLELLDAVLEAALEVAREANGLLVIVTQIDALEEIRTPPRTTLVLDIRQQGNREHTFDQFMTPDIVLIVRMPVVLLELVRGGADEIAERTPHPSHATYLTQQHPVNVLIARLPSDWPDILVFAQHHTHRWLIVRHCSGMILFVSLNNNIYYYLINFFLISHNI